MKRPTHPRAVLMVIPWPQSTSKLDVFELTPVPQQPE